MEKKSFYRILALSAALFHVVETQAEIKLPQFLTDSMVVQQQSTLTLAGSASGKTVSVAASWCDQAFTATIDEKGCFSLPLATPTAGGPYTLTLTDSDGSLTLRDLYAGEVWLCSGQSNMEMPLGGWGKVQRYREEIAAARYPAIRLLQVTKQTAFAPQADLEVNMGGWRTCSPATVENFSSIAYFYARTLLQELHVPVGVIDCSWGGTPAEAWTALGGVRTIDGFEQAVDLLEAAKGDRTKMQQGYESQLAEWMKLTVAEDLDFDKSQYQEDWKTMPIPCEWEKSVLGEFDGIVWLQRRLTIPAVMAGKPLQLELGYIDDEDVTYFNGVKIAQGSGYNTPRRYTVPAELVKEGEAVITIRVSDFGGGGGLWGAVASVVASNAGGSISLAGDWGYRVAADFSKLPAKPASVEGGSFPTVLYNAMLHPLHTLPIKGVLWYQGCANVGRDVQYGPLFRRLIKDWRTLWKQEDLPFYFVQLAGYLRPQPIQPESQWAALRQAQADALTLPHTGMAVAIDVGNPDDIHPKNKQEVARRLALLALRHTYNKNNIVAEAPALVRSERQGENEVVLTFDTDLVAASNVPTGFIVETASGEWQQPEATLTSSRTIVLKASSPIRSVRYNWADYPDGNLRGRTLLPVAPFQCNLGGFY